MVKVISVLIDNKALEGSEDIKLLLLYRLILQAWIDPKLSLFVEIKRQ